MKRRTQKASRVPVFLTILTFVFVIGLFAIIMSQIKPTWASHSSGSSPDVKTETDSKIDTDDYKYINKTKDDIYKGELVLINYKNEYKHEDQNVLQSVYDLKNSSYKVKDTDVSLRKTVILQLNELLKKFQSDTNDQSINVISGYRSRNYQQTLLDNKVRQVGVTEAAMWVSKPGYSEHHSGLALDLGLYSNKGVSSDYTGTGRYVWINQNCHRYGFIVRYPEDKKEITKIAYEPWHFRYVGIPHSFVITENNFCYEEYIEYLKKFEFSKEHLRVNIDGKEYEIYYTKNTKIPVPEKYSYSVSGNNVDGFIVTVDKSTASK